MKSCAPQALDDDVCTSPSHGPSVDPTPLNHTWAAGDPTEHPGLMGTKRPSTQPPRPTPSFRRPPRTIINWRAFQRGRREGCIHDAYTWKQGDELGEGAYGKVFRGKSRYDSKRMVAVKQVARASVDDEDSLWSEINILNELDHPNVLRFLEAYEDGKFIYIVTEVCLGGCLQLWLPKVCGDIDFAHRVARQVTGVLKHCHAQQICHRDLKLDNILLVRKGKDSPIRVGDFGLAKRCSRRILTQRMSWAAARSPNKGSVRTPTKAGLHRCSPKGAKIGVVKFMDVKGTPTYMAPEVISVLHSHIDRVAWCNREQPFYDFRCDIWSLGVIVYNLLTGTKPYSLEEVTEFVADGTPLPDLGNSSSLSTTDESTEKGQTAAELQDQHPDAWDFITQCLHPDFTTRCNAEQLISHRWLGQKCLPPTPGVANCLKSRLRSYSSLTQFKRAALLAAVRHLGAYEHEEFRMLFQRIDADNSGSVTTEDLRDMFKKAPMTPGAASLEDIANVLDSDDTGAIAYTEFLAALMDHRIEDREDLARAAFDAFDLDGDGSISKVELELVLKTCNADELMRLGDKDQDGEIGFEDFLSMLRDC